MFGSHKTFFLSSLIMMVGLVMSLFIQSETPADRGKFTISLDRIIAKEAIIPSLILFFFSFGWVAISAFIVICGESRGVEGMGAFFTAYAITLLITRPFFGRVADERGIGAVVVPSSIAFAISFVLMSVSDNLVMYVVSAVIAGFGYGGAQPALQAMCMSAVPKERRGSGANTGFIGIDGGQLVGGFLGGRIADAGIQLTGSTPSGYSFMYQTMVIPCALALAVYLLNRKQLAGLQNRD